MGSSGSSSPSETTTTTITEPPEYVKPYSLEMLERSGNLSNAPYQSYDQQRIAGLTPEHYAGLDQTTQRAMEGSPAINSATQHASNVFNDTYMNQGLDLAGQANPYADATTNQTNAAQTGNVGANQFLGLDNPYLNQSISKAQGDVVDQYQNVINPQLAAMDRASGAFGNSGMTETRLNSMDDLTENLGDISNSMRMADYNSQMGLAESDVNRTMLADQYNTGLRQGTDQYNAGLQQNDLTRNAALAQQQQLNTLGTYANERQNQMGAMEFAPALAEQDYIDSGNLLGVGDVYRGVEQQGLDFDFDQWQQEQINPYQQLDTLQRAIANSMGSFSSNVSSTPNAYSPNSTASMIGTGLSGYGAIQGLLG